MPGSHPVRSIIVLLCSALAAFGCAGTETSQGATGSLSLDLVLAGGIEIDEVGWQITGNGMDMGGSIDVSAPGSTASVEVFGLPPGEEPYVVELSAVSVDKEVTCRGSAQFDIQVGVTTDVMVMLNCKLPQQYGGVRVNGKFNICAQLTKVVVSPLQTSVGNDINLFSTATDEEGDPIATMWTSGSGSIADPMAASTTYTCTEVGDDDITVLVTDDGGTYCMSMWTVRVTCVAGEGNPCDGVTCEDDGNECTSEACNAGTGQCESSPVEDGTSCNDATGMCMSGECVPNDLCANVTCEDDGNECTSELCNPETGQCETSNVDDGTACGDGGACMGGTCIVTDLCADVICDDTGNECTVNVCNNLTGVCDLMNVPNGTECNGGEGACSAGECVANNLCQDVDCTSSNECVQDGTCDPADGSCTPGDNEPAGLSCPIGGGVCDGSGNCVECNVDADCGAGEVCTANVCVLDVECVVDGDCGAGEVCLDGVCIPGSVDYPGQTANLTVGCRNNVTADISILPFDLTVDPGPISPSSAFTASLDGLAAFSEAFLDAAQAVVPGGVRSGQLIVSNGGGLAATVVVGGAATGADVQLGPDLASLGSRCQLTGASCTGAPGQGDCLVIPVVSNLCQTGYVNIPVVEGTPNSAGGCTPPAPGSPPPDCNCAPCTAIDVPPATTKTAQCTANGFCVAGDLPLPLQAATGNYTAGATPGAAITYGWAQPYAIAGNGTITLPAAVFANAPAPVGVRVSAGGLFVALQCAGAVDSGGPDGVGVPDLASPTPASLLNTFLVP